MVEFNTNFNYARTSGNAAEFASLAAPPTNKTIASFERAFESFVTLAQDVLPAEIETIKAAGNRVLNLVSTVTREGVAPPNETAAELKLDLALALKGAQQLRWSSVKILPNSSEVELLFISLVTTVKNDQIALDDMISNFRLKKVLPGFRQEVLKTLDVIGESCSELLTSLLTTKK